MLDQMSNYPSPSGCKAAEEIVSDINSSNIISFTEKEKKQIYDIAYDILTKNPPRYSYAAWCMGGKKEYVGITMNMLVKKNESKKKIRAIIKTLVLLYRIYRKTQERMYAPGGTFEIEQALIWNPILINSIPPHPPPFFS